MYGKCSLNVYSRETGREIQKRHGSSYQQTGKTMQNLKYEGKSSVKNHESRKKIKKVCYGLDGKH